MADCRRCRWFVNACSMTPAERAAAYEWIMRNRPGEPLRGYCARYKRPVTYYRGRCPGFRLRDEYVVNRSLTEFMGARG